MAIVHFYLATRETLAHLTKRLDFERVPVAGDWFRIDAGGIFPHVVREVTFEPNGSATVFLGLRKEQDGSWSLIESDEDLESLIAELMSDGWQLGGRKPNKLYRN